jgi:hypothetical protein
MVLDEMDVKDAIDEERWEKLQQSLDLLFTKVSVCETNQIQMKAQLDLNSQVLDQATREQVNMAKQVAETGRVVAQLRLDKPKSPRIPFMMKKNPQTQVLVFRLRASGRAMDIWGEIKEWGTNSSTVLLVWEVSREETIQISACQKYLFPGLMDLTLEFGLIRQRTISTYTISRKSCGSLHPLLRLTTMLLSGYKCTKCSMTWAPGSSLR